MVVLIGAVASPSQGASYYERDGYYAKDDPEHRAASAWVGRGATELVTDDAEALKGQLEAVTGERLSALEGISELVRRERGMDAGASLDTEPETAAQSLRVKDMDAKEQTRAREFGRKMGL